MPLYASSGVASSVASVPMRRSGSRRSNTWSGDRSSATERRMSKRHHNNVSKQMNCTPNHVPFFYHANFGSGTAPMSHSSRARSSRINSAALVPPWLRSSVGPSVFIGGGLRSAGLMGHQSMRSRRSTRRVKRGVDYEAATLVASVTALYNHVSSRWGEGVPLTGVAGGDGAGAVDRQGADGGPGGADEGSTTACSEQSVTDTESEPKTFKGKAFKFFKILAPHVVLISMLLGYLSLGALTLTWLESGRETAKTRVWDCPRDKIARLLHMYDQIADDTWKLQQDAAAISRGNWTSIMRRHFLAIGQVHDGDRFLDDIENYPDVKTRWTFPTALLYALTVLTTCGYGEVGVYTPIGQLFSVSFALVGIPLMFITAADIGKFLSETLLKLVELAKRAEMRVKSWWHRYKSRKRRESAASTQPGMMPYDEDQDEFELDLAPEQMQKLWFPIITYVSVISGYCCLGAVMFRTWQLDWPFIHAFHFGFNLIVTVGLGEIVVTDPIFLCLIVAFVIIGLSVVTMCVDLASTHLKAYFARIHYFGRAKKFLDMGDDIRNMMEYLAYMRKRKGGQVTWQDVKDLMETIRLGPFAPRDAARMRWIDESTASALSTMRNNSMCTETGGHSRASLAAGGSTEYRLPARETPPPPVPPLVANHNKRQMLYGNYLPPRPPSVVPPTPSDNQSQWSAAGWLPAAPLPPGGGDIELCVPQTPSQRTSERLASSPMSNSKHNSTNYRRPLVPSTPDTNR